MLGTPPPGYNTNSVNSQSMPQLSVPGLQGTTAQGYTDPFRSSFSTPSSYLAPSSTNTPNPWYTQQQPNTPDDMIRALMGGQ